jgi:hypothetical protein
MDCLMLDSPCPDCLALLAEMRSATMEIHAIAENAKAQRRAGNPPGANVNEWWQNARARWVEASMDLTNHLATHRSTTLEA